MTDVNQLLLDWAKGKFPEWARDKVNRHNEHVAAVLKHNQRNPDYAYNVDHGGAIQAHTLAHLINCGSTHVSSIDHQWECGCYSEYTRDDSWVVHCRVSCYHNIVTDMRIELSSYDMPEVLQELADMDEGCQYDDSDY
jgi:hypothetical protein